MKSTVAFFFLLLSFYSNAKNPPKTSVLFIGNSYTFFNDMPGLFKQIAASTDRDVFVDTVVKGGQNLNYHATNPETYQKIREHSWDFVVVQGHSAEFSQPQSRIDEKTMPFAKQLVDSIQANHPCTKILFYMTWGYKNGNSNWAPISTYNTMQGLIEKEYIRAADLLMLGISPVGAVWQEVVNKNGSIELYDPDLKHPSLEGSYLSACTFFTTIFGVSPFKNSAMVNLPETTRNTIELAVANTVLSNAMKWRLTPEKPKMVEAFDVVLEDRELQLFNRSTNYDSVEWSFGDGAFSAQENPRHTYTASGNYKITLRATNECKSTFLERTVRVWK